MSDKPVDGLIISGLLKVLAATAVLTMLLSSRPDPSSETAGKQPVFPHQDAGAINPGFEKAGRSKKLAAGWEYWPDQQPGAYLRKSRGGLDDSACILIENPAIQTGCGAHQRLELNQAQSAPLYFSIHSRVIKAPRLKGKQALTYGALFKLTYSDGSEENHSAFFGAKGEASVSMLDSDWRVLNGYIWPPYLKGKPGRAPSIESVDVYLLFGGTGGKVLFDELQLFELSSGLDLSNPVSSPTRLLTYSTMNPAYAADKAEYWAETGLDGFMFDHGQLLFGDNPASAAELDTFKDCIKRLRRAGVDENFLIIQNRRGNGPDFSDTFDDAAWNSLLKSFTTMAGYARETGLKGLVLDMEPVISKKQPRTMLGFYPEAGHSEAVQSQQVFDRGRQTMQALEAAFPDITVILLPHLARHDSPNYRFYGDWFAGMAAGSNAGAKQLIVGEERSQTSWNSAGFNLNRILGDEKTAVSQALASHPETGDLEWNAYTNLGLNPAPTAFWRRVEGNKGQVHWAGRKEVFGDTDLGGAYVDKSAKYRADHFYAQLAAMHQTLPKARYCWIYDHGASMWQMSPSELRSYGPDGDMPARGIKWAYRARTSFSEQPTDPFLDYYLFAQRSFFGSDDPL